MIVVGRVPIIPPIFVPYFSAITVIKITTSADNINGSIVCNSNDCISGRWMEKLYKRFLMK